MSSTNKDKEKAQSAQKTDKKKSDFLIALKNNNGNISESCQSINIGRTFKQDAEDAQESLIDLAESKLVENIKENDNTSIIFFLKTKGKKRGYIEKQEVEHIRPIDEIEFNGI